MPEPSRNVENTRLPAPLGESAASERMTACPTTPLAPLAAPKRMPTPFPAANAALFLRYSGVASPPEAFPTTSRLWAGSPVPIPTLPPLMAILVTPLVANSRVLSALENIPPSMSPGFRNENPREFRSTAGAPASALIIPATTNRAEGAVIPPMPTAPC